ncbi:ubiA prenyltransferase domain-containing protein 1 homolog [Oppia nitens]|uniref:ubiA prenyltransferase domain-containing protein 1 homolog n=1 Tax=Oppia nitens TaxID=1686743 RepID=UPI0023D9ADE4|nr:ubiA prenyltransferase domain-containing protein 1 homolog [Oppia nitens]
MVLVSYLSRCHHYLVALRPWSFSASSTPVLLGTVLAYKATDSFSLVTLIATLLTVVSVHAAGNLVNTYCDFMKGIDSKRRADDRTLVDSILKPEEVVNLGVLSYIMGCIGFVIVVFVSPARMELLAVLYFGGLSFSFLYTGGIGLKYIALGDIIIMVTFGPVAVLYAFVAQTGNLNMASLIYAIPLALNTEAILHSNNTRDIESDRRAGCMTLAVLIGHQLSHILFALLLFIPYILFCVTSIQYSLWLLLPLITIKSAFDLEKQFRGGNLRYLPRDMAKLNLYFGVFYLIACCLSNPKQLPGIVRN